MVLLDPFHTVFPEFPVDFRRKPGSDAVVIKENHNIPDAFLTVPSVPDLFQPPFPDASDGQQGFRLPVQDLQCVIPEFSYDPFCHLRADPPDHAGG